MRKTTLISFILLILFSVSAFAEELNLKPVQKLPQKEQATEEPAQNIDKPAKDTAVRVGDIYVACKYYFSRVFSTRESIARKNICNGYFFGSSGMILLLQNEGVKTETCMPMDVSTEEVIRGFLEWTDKNQDKMQLPASATLLQIFRQNYPCGEYKAGAKKDKANVSKPNAEPSNK